MSVEILGAFFVHELKLVLCNVWATSLWATRGFLNSKNSAQRSVVGLYYNILEKRMRKKSFDVPNDCEAFPFAC